MKIYFEDGRLLCPSDLPFLYDYAIEAGEGYSCCEKALRQIRANDPESIVYTNHLGAISNFYAWNPEENVSEIYMRRNYTNEFVRIDILANGPIRAGQNVMAMYRAGVFGNIDDGLI